MRRPIPLIVLAAMLTLAGCMSTEARERYEGELATTREDLAAAEILLQRAISDAEASRDALEATGDTVDAKAAEAADNVAGAARTVLDATTEVVGRIEAVQAKLAEQPVTGDALTDGAAAVGATAGELAPLARATGVPWLAEALTLIGLGAAGFAESRRRRLKLQFAETVRAIDDAKDDAGGVVDFNDHKTKAVIRAGMARQTRDLVGKLRKATDA
jgi:hypothetical protein